MSLAIESKIGKGFPGCRLHSIDKDDLESDITFGASVVDPKCNFIILKGDPGLDPGGGGEGFQ